MGYDVFGTSKLVFISFLNFNIYFLVIIIFQKNYKVSVPREATYFCIECNMTVLFEASVHSILRITVKVIKEKG